MPRNLIIWNNESRTWREVRPIDAAHFRFLPLGAAMIDDLSRRAELSAHLAVEAEYAAMTASALPADREAADGR